MLLVRGTGRLIVVLVLVAVDVVGTPFGILWFLRKHKKAVRSFAPEAVAGYGIL